MIWDQGVNTGRLTPSEFVAVTSANAAKLFNIYPKKGNIAVGADADIVLWDASASQTLSVKTQKSLGDFNIFEGRTVLGKPTHTLSHGVLVYADGDLRAVRGAGQYVKRPPFAPQFAPLARKAELQAPTAVAR